MNVRIFIWLCLLVSNICYYSCWSQGVPPAGWSDLIRQPWYQGVVNSKPVFIYLNQIKSGKGYFFSGDKSMPDIYQFSIDKKRKEHWKFRCRVDGKILKGGFEGIVNQQIISGYVKLRRRDAHRLIFPPEVYLSLQIEEPLYFSCANPRYTNHVFHDVIVDENITFGSASGYYTSLSIDRETDLNYQEIILSALKRLYLDPTRKAILHILNKDPVSLVRIDQQSLYLDLYRPFADTLTRRPLIILAHGGAFIMGDKSSQTSRELALDFASKGFVVASINYRMGFNPASKSSLERIAYRALQDARAAARFLSHNAITYGIDPGQFFLTGTSAGAITCLNMAYMTEDERPKSSRRNPLLFQKDLGGLDESTNKLSGAYSIKAIANLWGAVHDTTLIDKEEQIPLLNIHGDADKIVPYGHNYPFTSLDTSWTKNIVGKLFGSYYIYRRALNQGIRSELVTFPGLGHEPQFEPGLYDFIMDTIITSITNFFSGAMFGFPEISGPAEVKMKAPVSLYSLPHDENLRYYWKVEGGKLLPGMPGNQARVVWLVEREGKVSVTLIHKNQACIELKKNIKLPVNTMFFIL